MAAQSKKQPQASTQISKESIVEDKDPRSLKIAEKGIKTGHDFANFMSAMMSDLIDGRVTPSIGNAACNAGGKLLKVVEMQYKYGTQQPNSSKRTLVLAVEEARDSVKQIAGDRVDG